jgi:hypothetical protein
VRLVLRCVAAGYRALTLLLLSTAVAFVAFNLALRPLFPPPSTVASAGEPLRTQLEDPALRAVEVRRLQPFFPTLTAEEIGVLENESLNVFFGPFRYQAYTQFREAPRVGRFVNVDRAGFRRGRAQGSWPPDRRDFVVFVFGGSTTFGYGVPDDDTVPSYLQTQLGAAADRAVRVYNFGRGYYFSTQERVLFERLLLKGPRPDLAVFVDGLNDFYNRSGEPEFTARLADLMTEVQTPRPSKILRVLDELPIGRAARWLRERLAPRTAEVTPRRPEDSIAAVVRRIRDNKRMADAVGRAYGVRTAWVWQPVPTYKYDVADHPFRGPNFAKHALSARGYPVMARFAAAGRFGDNFLWCADIQEGLREALYVDQVHYAPAMAERVAACIASQLRAHGLIEPPR